MSAVDKKKTRVAANTTSVQSKVTHVDSTAPPKVSTQPVSLVQSSDVAHEMNADDNDELDTATGSSEVATQKTNAHAPARRKHVTAQPAVAVPLASKENGTAAMIYDTNAEASTNVSSTEMKTNVAMADTSNQMCDFPLLMIMHVTHGMLAQLQPFLDMYQIKVPASYLTETHIASCQVSQILATNSYTGLFDAMSLTTQFMMNWTTQQLQTQNSNKMIMSLHDSREKKNARGIADVIACISGVEEIWWMQVHSHALAFRDFLATIRGVCEHIRSQEVMENETRKHALSLAYTEDSDNIIGSSSGGGGGFSGKNSNKRVCF